MQAVAHRNDVAALHLSCPVIPSATLGAGPRFAQCDVLTTYPAGNATTLLFLILFAQSETVRYLAQGVSLNQARGVLSPAGVDIEAATH